jgi:hypothetical protein
MGDDIVDLGDVAYNLDDIAIEVANSSRSRAKRAVWAALVQFLSNSDELNIQIDEELQIDPVFAFAWGMFKGIGVGTPNSRDRVFTETTKFLRNLKS